MNNPASFHAEARYQGACRQCGRVKGEWEAHHVVDKQTLRAYGAPLFDPRNALRACARFPGCCHGGTVHHKIGLAALTDDNIAFAFEWLGAYAYDYLRRHYPGHDERVEAKLREVEGAAA